MAKENLDKEDGVWRTVGGRRIFIRNGQSLSDAMIESGKFKGQKNKKGARESYREEIPKIEDERKEAKSEEQRLKRERESLINRYSNAKRDIDREYYGEGINNATKWIGEEKEKVENYDAMLDKEGQKASKERQKEFDKEHGKAEQLREEYRKNPENEATKEREKNLKKVEKNLEEEEQFDKESLEDWTRYRDRYQQSLDRSTNSDNKKRFMAERDDAQREIDEIKVRMNERNANKEAKGKEFRQSLEKLNDKSIEDGTYDLVTGKKVDFGNEGYNVSFEQSSDQYSDSEYYEKIEECRRLCDGNVYAGKFGGSPEISFYTKDKETAMKIMEKYNQHSIYDNSIDDIIENAKYNAETNKVDYKEKSTNETKQLASNSGQEKISDNVKVMRYGDDYIVLKNGHNEKEFKNQQDAENYAKTLTNNETMNNAIREKASKKSSKFEPDLPKHTEIKSQGTSNRKEVSENIQAHILDYYSQDYTGEDISPSEAFVRQMDAMSWLPNNWKRGEEIAKGGSYLIYNGDMSDFLDSLKINPKGKKFSEDKAFDMYTSLIGRESAKLYDRIKKNQYNEYKRQHPLTTMSFEDFKNMKKGGR